MKKLIHLLSCAVLLLSTSIVPQSQNEWERMTSCGLFNFDIGTKSISRPSPFVVEALVKITLRDESAAGRKEYRDFRPENNLSAGGYETFSQTHELQQFNCSRREHRSIQFTEYDREGKVLDSWSVRDAAWRAIEPDSIHKALLQAVCQNEGKSSRLK